MDVSQLDEDKREKLKKLKEAIKGCQLPDSSDAYLCKWLAARNYDVAASEKMLRNSLEWRKVNQMDKILETWTPPEVLKKFYPIGLSGHDKFGCPIWIYPAGRADQRGLLQSASRKDYMRYILYLGEESLQEMKINSQKLGRPVTQQCAVVDMEGLTMKQLTYKPVMDIGTEMNKILEANYPEMLRRVFIVNAPKIFTMVFAVMKSLMAPATLEKMKVFGTNATEWKAALLSEIDPEHLPAHYGGKLADPDGNPMYLTKVCMGGEVPKSYYLTGSKPKPKANMESVLVARGSKKKFKFDVRVLGSTLKWEFLTEDGDIGFHVYRIDGKLKVHLVPLTRVDSHLFFEEGVVTCTKDATYVIEFDNSYSYLRPKTVWYSVAVEDPTSDPQSGFRFDDSVGDPDHVTSLEDELD